MNKLNIISTAILAITLSFSSCGGDDNEYTKPSIEGQWTVNDRFLTPDQNDDETIKFTQKVNAALKANAKDDYVIKKTYIKRGETEDRGLVGDIRTEYTPLKEGYPTPAVQTLEFELKNDTISIVEDNLKNKGACNIGEKILIIKRKVTAEELKKILSSIALVIPDEIPNGYTATYTTYEIR